MRAPALINADCRDILPALPSKSFDLCLTSPPYNMNLRIRNGKYCSRQITKEISTKYEGFADNLPMDDYFEFNRFVVEQLIRTCGVVFYNVQILTGNKPALFKLIGHFHDKIKELIVWDKVNAEPAVFPGGGVLNSRYELLIVFSDIDPESRRFKDANFERGTLQNLWQIKRGTKRHEGHGAVFPLDLARRVLKDFCPAGGRVLDPFMGTGTTGEMCAELGVEFTGIEMLKHYFDFCEDLLQ